MVATTEYLRPLRATALALAVASLLLAQNAGAQGLRLPDSVSRPAAAATDAPRAADHIIAVVNSEPITASELRQRMTQVEQRLRQQGTAPPAAGELEREVLELLIMEATQLQRAAELGLRIDAAMLDQAEISIAQQNQLTVVQLRERLRAEGIDAERFRNEVRRDMLLQRVREREVESNLRVTDRDIDEHLLELRSQASTTPAEVNLGHILIQVPEGASPDVVAQRLARALRASEQARTTADFSAVAQEFSDGPEARTGGAMGLRDPGRYPSLFVQSTENLPVGAVTQPIRSAAGFHVLKVLERKQANGADAAVTQTRARHILLRPNSAAEQQSAIARLQDVRRRVSSGQSEFAALAREISQDGSARQGGDLGWASPGMFVPEFEEAMNRLAPGQISDPVVSRFGVHLIQVMERRQFTPTQAQRRDMVRNEVRQKKLEQAYATWARELRDRAYVELRQARQ